MSATPALAPRVGHLVGSVYSTLVARFAALEGETYPFHVGDTWLEPPEAGRTEQIRLSEHPGHNRYTPVPGLPWLRQVLADRVTRRTGVLTGAEEVLVCAGATAGFAAVLGAIVPEGGEVMILAPAWPLFAGTTVAFGGRPVHVPFMGEGIAVSAVASHLDAFVSDRTVAVYLNTPNNPTGRVLPADVVAAIAAWASARGIWLVSDEVYEDLRFEGAPQVYARTLAPERTISAWSFSKAFGMAGNRVGYVVAPQAVIEAATKLTTYTAYCAPHVGQLAAAAVLGAEGDAWVADAARQYAEIGAWCADRLGVARPEGSTFLFLDLAPHLSNRTPEDFLATCVDAGILLAPGRVFGPAYERHARLCYTAVEPSRTRRGVEKLAALLGR